MRIGSGTVRVNAGMAVAAVLLVAGGAVFLAAPRENELLRNLGLGVVVLASLVYLGARVVMIVQDRRR